MRNALLLAAVLLSATAALPARAADDGSPGEAMYLRYCGACHGPKAQGDGVAATGLRPKPSDLTRLAARHHGEFQAAKIAAFIDGTTPMAAHGSKDMPVWGETLRDDAPTESGTMVKSKIMLITEYLRTIQRK